MTIDRFLKLAESLNVIQYRLAAARNELRDLDLAELLEPGESEKLGCRVMSIEAARAFVAMIRERAVSFVETVTVSAPRKG